MNKLERIRLLVKRLIVDGTAANQKSLGQRLGYRNESSFSQILNGKVPIPADFISRLVALDPDINADWLENGKGTMMFSAAPDTGEQKTYTVPLLPLSAIGGSLSDFILSINNLDCEKVISPIRGVDFAITVSGDSMSPEYPSGSRVLIKKINEKSFIEWGRCYVLDTCNGTVIKKLDAPVEEDRFFGYDYVTCVSSNPDPIYKPFRVPLQDIYGVYRVMLLLTDK